MTEKLHILYHYFRTKYRSAPHRKEDLVAWQEKKIQSHLSYVQRHSPFYRRLWGDIPLKEWRRFPTIDKAMMMENFDQLNTVGIEQKKAFAVANEAEKSRDFTPMIDSITVGLSSGTSGSRGIFLVSAKERAAWAGNVLAKTLPRSIWHKERVAFFLRANSNLYQSVGRGHLDFRFYDLLTPLEKHIDNLHQQNPGVLVAPPSMLRLLAEAKSRNQLSIQPHKVISVAEVLDPLDEKRIGEAFAQPVHQIYQCTEGFLAYTCPQGTLHVNEDLVLMEREYLDQELGKFIPILTDFARRTQPIIRYRLNDILTERKTPCPCGSHWLALAKIEGRSDDLFYFPHRDSEELQPVFPDFIRQTVIHTSEKISGYFVIQHDLQHVEMILSFAGPTSNEEVVWLQQQIKERMEQLCLHTGSRLPQIQFTVMAKDPVLSTSSASHVKEVRKLRRIERRFDIEEA